MPRPVHFELPAADPERAAKFYTDVFGWTIQKFDGPIEYWLVTTGEDGEPGINGGIHRPQGPSQVTTNTIGVDDLDATVEKATAAGATVVAPRMAIPGMGWLAYLTDTEGNAFGLMEPDESAA